MSLCGSSLVTLVWNICVCKLFPFIAAGQLELK